MRMQAFLEKKTRLYQGPSVACGPSGSQGGLCEAKVDILRDKLGSDIKLLDMLTKHCLFAAITRGFYMSANVCVDYTVRVDLDVYADCGRRIRT